MNSKLLIVCKTKSICACFTTATLIAFFLAPCIGSLHETRSLVVRIRESVNVKDDWNWHTFDLALSPWIRVDGIANEIFRNVLGNHPGREEPFDVVSDVNIGWPFKSHSFTMVCQTNSNFKVIGKSGVFIAGRVIPFKINFIAFILNSCILFVPVLLGYCLFRYVLEQQRILKRRCVYCGYDIGGSIQRGKCPECGNELVVYPPSN